jgi:hypothetical protein
MDQRGYVTSTEMRQALRTVYQQDGETNLYKALLHALADDLRPIDENGLWRPNTLIVLVAVLLIVLLGIFLYFSIGSRG